MVQDIIMGRNEVFNEIFSKDYTNAILLVKKIFIDEDANVLTDFGRLNLLLAFNTKDGFYNLFTNFKAQHFIDDSVLFKWDEKLPLETICFVLRTCHKPIVIKTDRNIYTYIFNSYLFDLILDLYSIYRKFYKPIEEYKYYLPEGLIAINENNISDIDELSLNDEALVNEIQQNSKEEVTYFPRSLSIVGYKRKAIYFPKSLKVIGNTSKLFEDFPLTDIILNEGLEKILPKAFEMQKFSKINIPSTINTLSMTSFAESFSRGTIKTVTFNINKNNAPILNENIMNELFNGMPFHIFLELPFSNIIIHIEELDKDIDINLSDLDLSFDNLEQKNGRTNIKKLIKYFEELLDDERKTFSKMQPVIEEVDDRVEIRTDYKGLLTDLEILNKKFKEFAENNKDYAHYLASEIEDAYCFRNIEGNNYYEAMCNIFTYYGILDKSILENFYRLLFKNMIDSKRPFINDTLTKIELNIYSECIKSIINTSYEYPITSSNGQNVMPDEDAKEIQKLIIKILKGNKKEIAVKEILTNYFKLNLLFSYAKPKMLIDFFEQFTCSALKKELPHSQIEFSNNLPLGTFCLINYYLGESLSQSLILEQNNTTIPLYYDVYKLYHLIYKYYHSAKQLSLISKDKYVNSIANNPLYYFIPDGIIRIDISNGSNKTEVSDKIIDGIRNDAKDKYVFLPNSLKSFALDTISKVNTSVKEIYLNEGLETLYLITYLIQNFETLTIPSTVSRIEIFDYFLSIYNNENKGNFRNIIFNNFNLDNIEIIHTILKSVITRNDYRASNNLITFTFHYDNLDEDIIVKLDFDKYKHLREKGLDLTIKEWFINDTILEIKEKIVEKKGKSKILK